MAKPEPSVSQPSRDGPPADAMTERARRESSDAPASGQELAVRVTDCALTGDHHMPEPEEPDLEAKLAGLQSPRGWGLFLIKNMVDEMNVTKEENRHKVELVMNLKGDERAT